MCTCTRAHRHLQTQSQTHRNRHIHAHIYEGLPFILKLNTTVYNKINHYVVSCPAYALFSCPANGPLPLASWKSVKLCVPTTLDDKALLFIIQYKQIVSTLVWNPVQARGTSFCFFQDGRREQLQIVFFQVCIILSTFFNERIPVPTWTLTRSAETVHPQSYVREGKK